MQKALLLLVVATDCVFSVHAGAGATAPGVEEVARPR